jgi:hypothetical protein
VVDTVGSNVRAFGKKCDDYQEGSQGREEKKQKKFTVQELHDLPDDAQR